MSEEGETSGEDRPEHPADRRRGDLEGLARFVEGVEREEPGAFEIREATDPREFAGLLEDGAPEADRSANEGAEHPGAVGATDADADPMTPADEAPPSILGESGTAREPVPSADNPASADTDETTGGESTGEQSTREPSTGEATDEPVETTAAVAAKPALRVARSRGGSLAPPDDLELIDQVGEVIRKLRSEVGRIVVGQQEVVDELLLALVSGGHAVLEGAPGLAKTLLVNTLASTLSLGSGRIQFTPDLMPTDVTGTTVVQEDPETGERSFVFRKGPVFTNMLLADEINRTPPKTQASLLEGMSEGRVTVAGQRYTLPQPFLVVATQNPIEQEGTYPLPEAQLDRFLLKILVDYPEFDEERIMLERTTGTHRSTVAPVLGGKTILRLQNLVRSLPASDHVQTYATRLVRATRPSEPGPEWVGTLVAWGAGPRAAQSLILAAKARTILEGRFAVTDADIAAVAHSVLRHRVLPSFLAEAEGETPDTLIDRLLVSVPPTRESADYDPVTRRLLRL